ncbi:MAG TPA: esterase-like activity of phytase family protein, partial [Planctomycetaceae bacterium]|nr:esterase-like activity of phytase family protein [Planctomycetaceae bacterium]
EFAYPMDSLENGVSEILAWSPGQFLVLERDGNTGVDASYRKLTWIDISEATDIVSVEALPLGHLPAGTQPVQKRDFLDFLNPAYGLAGKEMPEKIEGLTFGPTLPDRRRTLVLAIDNDFEADKPSLFWVFAVGADVTVSAR